MRKILMLGMTIVVSFLVLLFSCTREEQNENGGNQGGTNQEEPSDDNNQEDSPTIVLLPHAVTDRDGNSYDAVKIGDQVWMTQNLRTTRYSDGTEIPLGTTTSYDIAYRYAPNGNQSNVPTYGYLYNWKAVMRGASSSSSNPSRVQGICPTGWHVPSMEEFKQLTNYVKSHREFACQGQNDNYAKALASTSGWKSDNHTCSVGNNQSTNNATNFTAVPSGYYATSYDGFGSCVMFWSATQSNGGSGTGAQLRYLSYSSASVPSTEQSKTRGCPVRCVRD